MADLIRVPPIGSPVITDAAALALRALAQADADFADGAITFAQMMQRTAEWERRLVAFGGVPLGSLVQDGVRHG